MEMGLTSEYPHANKCTQINKKNRGLSNVAEWQTNHYREKGQNKERKGEKSMRTRHKIGS